MDAEFPGDALAFGDAVRSRLQALGGVRLALRAESDPAARHLAADALAEVGAWDVDPRAGIDGLLASAQLCRMAGAVVLPYPVVERLLRIDGSMVALVDPDRPWVDHGDVEGTWLVADLDGRAHHATAGQRLPSRLGPFVTRAHLDRAAPPVDVDDVARHLMLGAWRIVGALDAALGLAASHVVVRRQFGKPLADFQAVRFASADAVVAVRGLEELAKFTAWRLGTASASARWADAVALRLHAVDVARDVLRCCHQLFGAIGFCDEHDLSVLDRHLQPLLRLPYAAEALAERLVPAVSSGALEGLFTSAPS